MDARDRGSDQPEARSHRLPMLIGGTGVLLVGGSVGVLLSAYSSYHAAQDEQRDQSRRDSLYNSANTKRHVAFGLGAAGVACAGVAAWLYFTDRPEERPHGASAQVHVVPLVADSGAGLVVVGGF